jgi:hypothetical protein
MKLELKKLTLYDGVWYAIAIDGENKEYRRDFDEAESLFDEIKENIKKMREPEILKTVEI